MCTLSAHRQHHLPVNMSLCSEFVTSLNVSQDGDILSPLLEYVTECCECVSLNISLCILNVSSRVSFECVTNYSVYILNM